jgi:hypothetical protein
VLPVSLFSQKDSFRLGAVWPLRILYCARIIVILYTLDSASNYSAIQKLKP